MDTAVINVDICSVSIILIEDDQDDIFFFLRSLSAAGFPKQCIHVFDGNSVRSYLEAHARQPHLVFLDLKMSRVNGFEFLEWLSNQSFRSFIEIVVLSGSNSPDDFREASALGALDFLPKPLSSTVLAEKIHDWLHQSAQA